MKRILLLLLVMLASSMSFAQNKQVFKQLPQKQASATPINRVSRGDHSRKSKPIMKAAGDELVTPPSTATVEAWTIDNCMWYLGEETGWSDISDEYETLNVVVDGQDIYIQGLAYWFADAWIKGTMDGSTVTFPSSTYVGTDEYGDEYLLGSSDGGTVSPIVFTYDASSQTLTLDTYIIESEYANSISAYAYWGELTLVKGGVADEVVTPPSDLELSEWTFVADELVTEDGENYTSEPIYLPLAIGYGEDGFIYIQGLCSYLPESWLKGTFENDVLTIPFAQYYGKVQGYKLYFSGVDNEGNLCDATFTYDSDKDVLTSQTDIVLNGSKSILDDFHYFTNVLLVKSQDKAGTPSTPSLVCEETSYGPCLYASIPLFDTEGVAMTTSKLFYRIYKEIDHVAEVYTLKAGEDAYQYLTEDMTEVPYLFTEDWDIYPGANPLYLYADDYDSWYKVGIQMIYTGGGETHESEIAWYEIKPYPQGTATNYTFDFNAMPSNTPVSTSSSHAGDITEDLVITNGIVNLTVTPSGANTANRWWKNFNSQTIQLRVYGGTMTFKTTSGDNIMGIEFYNSKWDEDNSTDIGNLKEGSNAIIWVGAAPSVELSIAGNTQLDKIVVTIDDTTGIETITTYRKDDDTIYNLQGQRVIAPTRGIYIVNGKKVLF